jgi:hypothetical protein
MRLSVRGKPELVKQLSANVEVLVPLVDGAVRVFAGAWFRVERSGDLVPIVGAPLTAEVPLDAKSTPGWGLSHDGGNGDVWSGLPVVFGDDGDLVYDRQDSLVMVSKAGGDVLFSTSNFDSSSCLRGGRCSSKRNYDRWLVTGEAGGFPLAIRPNTDSKRAYVLK